MKVVRSLAVASAILVSCAPPKGSPDDRGGPQYVALETAPTATPAEASLARATRAIGTAFVIVMENHPWGAIVGNRSAPYINDVLLRQGAHANAYFDANVHPSEPNYIWMEAGSNLAITDDDDPAANHRTTRKHLTSLLDDAAIPWKSYQEGIDGASCPLTGGNGYVPRHDPMVFFDDVTDGLDPHSAHCIAHVRPYAELAQDLAADRAPAYAFLTPTLCHDMHDDCGGEAVANGDAWLAAAIPAIQASAAYQRGGAIFLTWDEDELDDGSVPVGMIVLSPNARPGYASATHFSHSSLLRTLEDVFGVSPYLRDAAQAPGLDELFVAFP